MNALALSSHVPGVNFNYICIVQCIYLFNCCHKKNKKMVLWVTSDPESIFKRVWFSYRGLAMSWGRWNHSCSFASCPAPTCMTQNQERQKSLVTSNLSQHVKSIWFHIYNNTKQASLSHLHHVGARLHRACPVVSALCDSHVGHQQVRRQVARSECAISRLQEGEAWHTAGVGLAFTQCQPVSVQPPAWVQGETQHWEDRKRMHTRTGRKGEEVERWRIR